MCSLLSVITYYCVLSPPCSSFSTFPKYENIRHYKWNSYLPFGGGGERSVKAAAPHVPCRAHGHGRAGRAVGSWGSSELSSQGQKTHRSRPGPLSPVVRIRPSPFSSRFASVPDRLRLSTTAPELVTLWAQSREQEAVEEGAIHHTAGSWLSQQQLEHGVA